MAAACGRIHHSLDIAHILNAAVKECSLLFGVDGGACGLWMEEQLVFSECRLDQHDRPFDLRIGVTDPALAEPLAGKIAWLNRLPDDSQLTLGLLQQDHDIRRAICAPVHGHDARLLAVLVLFNRGDWRYPASEIRDLIGLMAEVVGVAIENAILLSSSRQAEADLQKSVATYRSLVEQIPAMTFIATLDKSRMLFVSPQVESLLGYTQDEFLETPDIWLNLVHPEDRATVEQAVHEGIEHGEAYHLEYRILTRDGQTRWVLDHGAVVHDDDGAAIYMQGVMSDITRRKETEQQLREMAHFDQLTKLPNRTLFLDRLDQAIAYARRGKTMFALLYMDLDGFKAVNDTMGHEAGDAVLVEAGQRILKQVREVDTVARMGGDEFTVILLDIHAEEDAKLVTDRIIESIREPYEIDGQSSDWVSASIGVVLYPDHIENRDALITAADDAMYGAKRRGKNNVRFYKGA